uniref:Mannose receptor, C type 1b n=1 Tax=Astyanax mexicanus TaxID=7994 RepID=A0A8B9GUK3_ASTMX
INVSILKKWSFHSIYTIKGNALGRPCNFPFLFNNKWYSDCTTDFTSLPWCAVESEFDPNQLWGYCPSPRVNEFWKRNPLTNVYYQVNEDSALTWYQARKSCQQQEGDLVSITEPHQQTFISGLIKTTGPVLWTGLNSLESSGGWRWGNEQPLRYLKWMSGQPSSLPDHSCGVLSQLYGSEWSTAVCSEKHGYICQRGLPTPTVPPVVHTGSCYSPWIPYSGHCYLLSRTKRTWLEARDACRREGGDLLSILNVEEQSFTITQLGYSEFQCDYSTVNFAHTCTDMPHCAGFHYSAFYFFKGWVRYGSYCYLLGSNTKTFGEAKKMCETTGSYLADITNRIENAFLVSLTGARPETHFWIGLSNMKDEHTFEWTNSTKVPFTHFNVGMPGGKQGCVAMTTGITAGLWDVLNCTNAEKYICKQKAEGVLTPEPPTTPAPTCSSNWYPVTNRNLCFKLFKVIEDQKKSWSEALDFCRELGGDLLSIHSASDLLTPAWIGYSIQDPSAGYEWSDGSSSSYENWSNGEPNNLNNVENCVKLEDMSWMSMPEEWNDISCDERMDWFCEIQKGEIPKEVDITRKSYNKTEDDWIIFKDNQYYFSEESFSMEEGRRICKGIHGDLVVINDDEERVFLWHLVKERKNAFYIGMHVDLDKSVSWLDGTPVVYQAWLQNQPAFLNNDEHCVKMTRFQGLWQTQNCGDPEGLVCERSGSIPANATAVPTDPPTGGCAPDWMQFQEKCYKIGLDLKTWTEARSYCKSIGGNLASINKRLQQAFLTSKMDDPNIPDLWNGLNSFVQNRLKWTDGSSVLFSVLSDTVKMPFPYPFHALTLYSDRSFTPSPTDVPRTFIKLGNSSYMLVKTNMTWEEAQSHCQSVGANLASIRDAFTQSYIELQTHEFRQPIWIGLNSMETDGYFLWIDKFHLNMEKWDRYEPGQHPCVYVDVYGAWKTTLCNKTYYSIFLFFTEIAPTLPAQYSGVCPEDTEDEPKMTWLPYKGHCYAIVKRKESWSAASRICTTRGANLVSILDTMESTFIERCIRLFGDRYNSYWIGLFKTHAGHWLWLDKSVMDYTNWKSSEYEWFRHRNTPCVTIMESKWRKTDCDTDTEFICKTEKGTFQIGAVFYTFQLTKFFEVFGLYLTKHLHFPPTVLPTVLPTAPPTETVHTGNNNEE